jgi:hypothetical protein
MKEKDENIENWLGNIKKSQPFRVPENYFENFGARLKVRIEEEEQASKKRSMLYYLKPFLTMAASFVLVMLLVYWPIKKFFPAGKGYFAQKQLNNYPTDSVGIASADFISYFSEGQFMSAFSEMNEIDSETLSTDKLADYISANYNDYDIISNN